MLQHLLGMRVGDEEGYIIALDHVNDFSHAIGNECIKDLHWFPP